LSRRGGGEVRGIVMHHQGRVRREHLGKAHL
jgi:hypothetical protein